MGMQELKLDQETMQAQRAARNMIKRDTRILIYSLLGSFFLLYVLNKQFPITLILFLPIIISFLVINNWRQWNALIVYQLRCPHCGKLLADRVNFFLSPSPRCRYCHEIALVSIQQLEQNEEIE